MVLRAELLFLSGSSGYGIPGNRKLMAVKTVQTKLLLFFVFILCTPLLVQGQDDEQLSNKGTFNIGAEGGVQFSNVDNFSSRYEAKSKTGFNVGAFVEYYVSSSFKLRSGFYYDSRGFNAFSQTTLYAVDSSDNIKSYLYLYDVDYKLNYLTIPLGIAFERGSEKLRLMIQVNFYYSLLLNANMEGTEAYYFDPEQGIDLSGTILNQGLNEFSLTGSTDGFARTNIGQDRISELNTDNFNTNDIGFNLLVGLMFNVTKKLGLFANFGFSYSMGRLYENPEMDSKWSQLTKVNLGISYHLGR